jgi:hypothetical protein
VKSRVTLVALLFFAATPAGLGQWVQTGGPEGGYINALAEDDSFPGLQQTMQNEENIGSKT